MSVLQYMCPIEGEGEGEGEEEGEEEGEVEGEGEGEGEGETVIFKNKQYCHLTWP
jgi:hypothetical protein